MDLVGRAQELRTAQVASRSGEQVLVLGPPGSGRTAFLRCLAIHLTVDGGSEEPDDGTGDETGDPPAAWLLAGRDGAAGVPLAPAAPLMAAAGLDPADPLVVYTRLPAIVRETGQTVLVDDVDKVDRATGVLLAQLARAGVPLVLAAPTETDLPHGLRDVLKMTALTVVSLDPLAIDDVLALGASEHGGELDVVSGARVVAAGRGLPGRVVEVLRAGRAGSSKGAAGVRLGDQLLTDVLRDRVRAVLDALPAGARHVVDLVVVCGQLPELALALALDDADVAVAAGALDRTTSGAGTVLLPPDAVLAAAVLERLGPSRMRDLRAEARRALDAAAVPSAVLGDRALAGYRATSTLLAVRDQVPVATSDLVDAALWALEAHRVDDAAILVEAGDPDDDPRLLLLRARVRSASGATQGAADDLAAASTATADPATLVEIGHELGLLHAVRRGDPATAVLEVQRLVAGLGPTNAVALAADLVKWRLMAGQAAASGPDALPGTDGLTEAAERISVAVIGAMVGCLDGPLDVARRVVADGLADVERSPVVPPHSADLLQLSGFLTSVFDGRVDEAAEQCRTLRDAALTQVHPSVGLWEYAGAELGLHVGSWAASVRLARRAAQHLLWQDFTGLRDSAWALLAALEARSGCLDAAAEAAGRVDEAARSDVKVDLHLARVAAELARRRGEPDAAADLIARPAHRALEETHAHLGLLAVDEAFLVATDPGRRREYAATLAAHAARSPLFEALASRASTVLDGDPRGVERAAGALDAVGLRGRALHAYEAAARLHAERGAREAASRLGALADGVRGDATAWPTDRGSAALSPRELEIARRVAGRARSREIADELGVSVRTVDNHLSRIFRKLGVTSRDEVAAALGGD